MPIDRTRLPLIVSLLLVGATLVLFWQTHRFEFINYDDNQYVTENPHVKAGLSLEGMRWAFTTTTAGNWHPLTWLSHMLDVQLFALSPGPHHLVNLLFHLINTLLLFLVLLRMTKQLWPSAFTAALFAVHPLHVESVAWIAERKDVLSTFFGLLTLWAYLRYAEVSGGLQRLYRYLLVLLLFALGLMAKPMLVTLPFVLLLIDYWPLQRVSGFGSRVSGSRKSVPSSGFRVQGSATKVSGSGFRVPGSKSKDQGSRRTSIDSEQMGNAVTSRESDSKLGTRNPEPGTFLLLEKLPLIALSLASCVVTFIAQRSGGAVSSFGRLSLGIRIENALVSYVAYILKMLWPLNLAIFYPHPKNTLPLWEIVGSAFLLLAVSIAAFRKAKSRPYLVTGWLWYLGTLVPVIGLVQVGAQAMADRYTYFPLIGIFIMIAWGVADLVAAWPRRKIILAASACTVIALLGAATWVQIGYWKNSTTLFTHAIRVMPGNYVAYKSLGLALADQGKMNEAISQYERAIAIDPNFAEAHNSLGNTLFKQKRFDEAAARFSRAVSIEPGYEPARYNLGLVLIEQGKLPEAVAELTRAIALDPNDQKAQSSMGLALARQGKTQEAIVYYDRALALNPDDEVTENNIGSALYKLGRLPEAAAHFSESLRINPSDPHVHYNLGVTYAKLGRTDEAQRAFEAALKLDPDFAEARKELDGIRQSERGR
ncbi:MAG TPA: tetratricopeptide repeat protein [Nitrospiria bacterium]|nr:tetratricopeptide repeat protein [Nitrospiria bacterium]